MNLLFAESYGENHNLGAKSNDNMKQKNLLQLLIKFQFLKIQPIIAGSLASPTWPVEKIQCLVHSSSKILQEAFESKPLK